MQPKPYDGDNVIKRHEQLKEMEEGKQRDHTLQENAKERAKHPEKLNSGTQYDWEDVDRYRKELERMDDEGPSPKKID